MSGQAVLNGIHKIRAGASHVGLMLEKLSDVPEKEEHAKALLDYALGAKPSDDDAKHQRDAIARHRKALESIGATCWTRTTASSLALHLAKAGIFENKGVSFHRCLGFAVIPGTGLKGMARAWAKQSGATEEMLLRVFGTERPEGKGAIEEGQDRAGRVVFHDAWPVVVPKLQIDLLASHHPDYYAGKGAPGDWEGPKMVSFLTVEEGSRFIFAISGLSPDEDPAILAQAREWLDAALTHLGAGSKTNTGFGYFDTSESAQAAVASLATRKRFATTLELVTPAWLGGAGNGQSADDCRLRGSSLRGQLRWWWRTMHAGQIDHGTLSALEAALWGSSKHGGAIALRLETLSIPKAMQSPLKKVANGKLEHNKSLYDRNKLTSEGKQDTPGLAYAGYGVHEMSRGAVKARYVLQPPASWGLALSARNSHYPLEEDQGRSIDAETVLEQARCALWLLCRFGGVGAKSRNGYGSLATPEALKDYTLDRCRASAKALRAACGITNSRRVDHETPSIDSMLPVVEVPTEWRSPWAGPHYVGETMKAVAGTRKHQEAKVGLGLPRKIHGPLREPLRHQAAANHQQPLPLSSKLGRKSDRHPAPIFYSVDKAADGKLVVRILAMTDRYLVTTQPSHAEHHKFLEAVLPEAEAKLREFARQQTAAASAASTPPLASKTVRGDLPFADRVRQEFPARNFNPGNPFAKSPEKVQALLAFLRDNEADAAFAKIVAEYAKELRANDVGRWKDVKKDEVLKPLHEYLRTHTNKP